MPRIIALLMLAMAPSAGAQSQPATDGATHIELRRGQLIDLHFTVRAAASGVSAPETPGLAEAAAVARELEAKLGGAMGWGLLEGVLLGCETIDEAAAAFARLPASRTLSDGRKIEIGEGARKLIDAYRPLEAPFKAQLWPQHAAEIALAEASLKSTLLAHERRCFEHVCDKLAMRDPHLTIPIYLVGAAPSPGGFTVRTRAGAACIVGVDSGTGSLLAEVALHECIHALDLATQSSGSALADLSKRLRAAGVEPSAKLVRDVPHTLIFVQAAETVTRVIDPNHRPYGVVAGYYDKVAPVAAIVRPAWAAYLDGGVDREGALAKIAEGAAGLLNASAPQP